MSNTDSLETIVTDLGEVIAHPAHITTHYGSTIITRTIVLPDDGVTINGVTYQGSVSLTVYRGRDYVITDCSMVYRQGSIGSWGTITDAARRKVTDTLSDIAADLLATAGDSEWRREYVATEVRRSVLSEVRNIYRNAWRTERDLGEDVNAQDIARDVLLNLTADEITSY